MGMPITLGINFYILVFLIVFIRKLHQVHFVFLLIVLGYQSLLYASSFFSFQHLISIAGKEFTSHGVYILSFFDSSLVLSLVFIFGSEALLFISFFWASFHSLSSPSLGVWPGEGFY